MSGTEDGISAKGIVDTLFGPQEAPHPEYAFSADEELPSLLFGGAEEQEMLPLTEIPYYKRQVIEDTDLNFLTPFLDELALFEKRWGYAKDGETRDEWCARMQKEAVPLLKELTELCAAEQIVRPQILCAYLPCAAREETLLLYPEDKKSAPRGLVFPRLANGSCFCDKFRKEENGKRDVVGVIAVNLGRTVLETVKKWMRENRTDEGRLLDGFAAELLRAATEYAACVMKKDNVCAGCVRFLGMSREGDGKMQEILLDLTCAQSVGITFSRSYLMMPEYTSLALLPPR